MRCARLDVSENDALAKLLIAETAHAVVPLRRACICACDMSYDEDAIENLFASARTAAATFRLQ
eukprot:3314919-Prymnesium_polylepis.1